MSPSQSDHSVREWVAVIDDHESLRNSLVRVLQAFGIAAEPFGSAEDYLRLGHHARPCCLVLDVQLPGMNGFELERELSARDPSRPPIIFISALNANQLSDTLGNAQRCSYLQKPFTVDALMELLGPHLKGVVGCDNQTGGRLAKSSWQSTHG